MQLMGVRQRILLRAHVDGYRFVRLTTAQLAGFPFSPLEQWRLRLLRTAHLVFKMFTKGLDGSASCPIALICDLLLDPFRCATLHTLPPASPQCIAPYCCARVLEDKDIVGV